MRFLYTLILRIAAPLYLLWVVLKNKRGKDCSILSLQRFGFNYCDSCSISRKAPIWVHAASIGEARAAQPLVKALLAQNLPILLTHMTSSGYKSASQFFRKEIMEGRLFQTWVPYDFPGAVNRFIGAFRPRCSLIMEREIWPNLLAVVSSQKIPIALINGRLSENTLHKLQMLDTIFRKAFKKLDIVLVQTRNDAKRLELMGIKTPKIVGNLKFDFELPKRLLEKAREWRTSLKRPVVAIANTHEHEDVLFIKAIQEQIYELRKEAPLYLLIPRHPQRFEEVARVLRRRRLSFARRSQALEKLDPRIKLVLGDSMGETPFYYAAADVAIVAGSFLPIGGHNFIEASACGTPVIVGQHTFNFAQAVDEAISSGAILRADTPNSALRLAHALLQKESEQLVMKKAARNWLTNHTGATKKTLVAIKELLY